MKLKTKFQDEDFELGEVVEADIATMPDGRIKLQAVAKKGGLHTIFYDKLEKICSDWEDASEEPKDIWWLDNEGGVNHSSGEVNDNFRKNREIGNYFLSREEAESAVKRLKALKRLKDKNIFAYLDYLDFCLQEGAIKIEFQQNLTDKEMAEVSDDLDTLLGEEDEE